MSISEYCKLVEHLCTIKADCWQQRKIFPAMIKIGFPDEDREFIMANIGRTDIVLVLFLLLCNGIVLLVMKHIYYHRIKICQWQIDVKILLLRDVYSIFQCR